jgi:protein involved in polysaccharide export with SLBB domain
MRTLIAIVSALALHPCAIFAQSAFSPGTRPAELEVPVRKASPVVRPAAPVATPASESGGQASATFRPGDTFELRLSGMPADDAVQFAQAFTIGGDGFLSVPLAGQIRAAGLSQSQLERAIERKLVEEQIFRFPTATINVGASARFVTVGGQVRNPNRFPWSPDLTLLSAISAAGGAGDFGGDKVELIRGGKVSVFSTKKLRRDPVQDPRLFPGDRLEQR